MPREYLHSSAGRAILVALAAVPLTNDGLLQRPLLEARNEPA